MQSGRRGGDLCCAWGGGSAKTCGLTSPQLLHSIFNFLKDPYSACDGFYKSSNEP